jgi:hypothetical protein
MFKCKTTNNNSSEKGEKTIGEKKKKLELAKLSEIFFSLTADHLLYYTV